MNSTLNFIDGHQISYAVAGACALFLFLLLLFELLRTRLYWIYEPRVHRDDYKSKTPPAPGRTPFASAPVPPRRNRWKNDLNGAWCFRRGSALYWLQGHAVWHVLTMGALGCIYWFFRSERLVD